MYTEFFGLREKPFAITPDPRYLYMSVRHADALAHLIYGISESGGFIQLTGEVGTGKTTLIRSLLEQMPDKAEIALILNPQLSTREFLQVICEELRTAPPRESSIKGLIDVLNAHLLLVHATGRRVVLIVDEAQTLSAELLEQVRLLTNLETAKQKLLQIILIGQPELRDLLDRADMRQLAQRVTGRYHLEPLRKDDTAAYVHHRLRVAGAQSEVFKRSAIRELFKRSRGIPRLINVIADRALLAAYSEDRRFVDGALVARAASEVFGRRRPLGRWWPWAAAAFGVTSFAVATTNLWQHRGDAATRDTVAAVKTPAPSVAVATAELPTATPFAGTPATSNELGGATPATPAAPVDDTVTPATAPPAPAAAPASVTFPELLRTPGFAATRDAAIGGLLRLWGATYDADPAQGEPCAQAENQGLRCLFQQRGSLGELRRVNWPAVLSLVDEQGAEHPTLIAALGYSDADVLANGATFKLPLAELTVHWYGDHLLVWRPPFLPPTDLIPGSTDDGVLWLRSAVAQLRGEPAPSNPSRVYDTALESRVREYQRSRQLDVDGIVGSRTQISMLADLELPNSPLLVAGP